MIAWNLSCKDRRSTHSQNLSRHDFYAWVAETMMRHEEPASLQGSKADHPNRCAKPLLVYAWYWSASPAARNAPSKSHCEVCKLDCNCQLPERWGRSHGWHTCLLWRNVSADCTQWLCYQTKENALFVGLCWNDLFRNHSQPNRAINLFLQEQPRCEQQSFLHELQSPIGTWSQSGSWFALSGCT